MPQTTHKRVSVTPRAVPVVCSSEPRHCGKSTPSHHSTASICPLRPSALERLLEQSSRNPHGAGFRRQARQGGSTAPPDGIPQERLQPLARVRHDVPGAAEYLISIKAGKTETDLLVWAGVVISTYGERTVGVPLRPKFRASHHFYVALLQSAATSTNDAPDMFKVYHVL